MGDLNEDYHSLCQSSINPTESMTGGSVLDKMLNDLPGGTPEDAVAKLSPQQVEQLRSELAVGRKSMDMNDQELAELERNWKSNAACYAIDQNSKAYIQRQRIALELRYRSQKHTQQVGAWESDKPAWLLEPGHDSCTQIPTIGPLFAASCHNQKPLKTRLLLLIWTATIDCRMRLSERTFWL